MTLLEVGMIAKLYDTDIAHAFLHAIAIAIAEGRTHDSYIGEFDNSWGLVADE